MSLPLDPKVLLFLSLCDVQLTSLITWWAATAPDQARTTSSSPQWRKPQKGCWPAAPTISSPSSPMTTKTITCLGNGASLSRRIGRTDFFLIFFPPFPHSLAGPPMSSSALFPLFFFSCHHSHLPLDIGLFQSFALSVHQLAHSSPAVPSIFLFF